MEVPYGRRHIHDADSHGTGLRPRNRRAHRIQGSVDEFRHLDAAQYGVRVADGSTRLLVDVLRERHVQIERRD